MPTKWKRHRCALCNRTVVAWKLRFFGGKRYCHNCVNLMYVFSEKHYQNAPVKAEILKKAKIIKVTPKKTTYSNFGK